MSVVAGPSGREIDDLNLGASLGEGLGNGVGAVVVGRDRDPPADHHGEAAEVDERRVGRHDAGTVVVGNDQGPLDRAGGDHDPLRADAPERVWRGSASLPGADEVVIVDSERGRRSQHAPAVRLDRGANAFGPLPPIVPVDDAAAMRELAADVGVVFDQDHVAPGFRGRPCRGEP